LAQTVREDLRFEFTVTEQTKLALKFIYLFILQDFQLFLDEIRAVPSKTVVSFMSFKTHKKAPYTSKGKEDYPCYLI
jgi:hypothetical protein